MKYSLNPKKGEKVRIRIKKWNGDKIAVDAIYVGLLCNKIHSIDYNGVRLFANNFINYTTDDCRLIYPLELMPKPEVRE